MESGTQERGGWFWATLILSSISIAAFVFGAFELIENRFYRDVNYITLHYLYVSRGIVSSLLLAMWAAWFVMMQRRASERQLRRSWERYRGLLEASPGAVALYDAQLRVSEWNAAAERLYGYSKDEVIGQTLPTLAPEEQPALGELLQRVEAGKPVLDVETQRRGKDGVSFDVQLSLLPFRESAGQNYFLEVTSDIRERVRLRKTLLEIEKLTTMGQMAAGTAHHLNTPLAALLLRVQMMRERPENAGSGSDLERLENGIRFCQQFVQRLLDFSRRPRSQKQPEDVARTLESVMSFLAPTLLSKRAQVALELDHAAGAQVLADRNQLEALFLILLSNALDAMDTGGCITVRCRAAEETIEVQVADNGRGIAPADLQHIFEPFFTTKPPGQGTGLGLAIARSIVVEHGGAVRLESTPGQGTTAFVQLPRWHAAARGVAT
jgi:PAS domain S-box-containing protein